MKKFLKKILIIFVAVALLAGAFKVYNDNVATVKSGYSIASRLGNDFYLTAHRGLSSVAPENTAASLEEAGKAGYYAAEFDIRPTKDGVWVLIHDESLDRTTDGTGSVSDFTYQEMLQLKIDAGNGVEKYPDLGLITLEQALEICEKYGMKPMVEIKGGEPEDMAQVLGIIEKSGAKQDALIIDFSDERLRKIRELDKEIELWYLINNIEDEDIVFAKENSTALAFSFGRLKNLFRLDEAKKEGIKLASWTVDYLPFIDILAMLDVDYITTNRILP